MGESEYYYHFCSLDVTKRTKLETELRDKLDWIHKSSSIKRHSRLAFNQAPESLVNTLFTANTFWTHPRLNARLKVPSGAGTYYPGEYETPIQTILNPEFREFFVNKAFIDLIEELKNNGVDSSKQKLQDMRSSKRDEIDHLQEKFQPLMNEVAELLTFYIKSNSADVVQYAPDRPSTLQGEITDQRDDLITRAETAFYGVYCGSIFAHICLLPEFLTSKDQHLLDSLWQLQKQINEHSKVYVCYQMLFKHFQSAQGRKKAKDVKKEAIDQIVKEIITKVGNEDEQYFKKFVHQGGPHQGKFNRSQIIEHIIKKDLHKIEGNPNDEVDPRTLDRWVKELLLLKGMT